MIPKYRNRGIFQLVCAILMTAVLVVGVGRAGKTSYHTDGGWIALALVLYIAAYIMWTKAGFSFVRAKGYPRDYAGQMFLFLIILGFCFPGAAFVLPAVALFGLDDRSGTRKRR